MLHPFISTLIRRPNLLVDHLAGYADLIREEASEAGADLVQRVVAWVLVIIGATVFMILSGIALMLGAVGPFHWALLAVPLAVLALTVVAVIKARQPVLQPHFAEVKAQVDRDAQALRSVT
jgi:heme exporter protein D